MKVEEYSNVQLLELYIAHLLARNRSPNTIKTFKSLLKKFIEYLGNKHV